jgi:hypothetical protein
VRLKPKPTHKGDRDTGSSIGALAELMALSLLLVGMMAKSVWGQLPTRTKAPRSQSYSFVCHHANRPRTDPTRANGACMAKPRL